MERPPQAGKAAMLQNFPSFCLQTWNQNNKTTFTSAQFSSSSVLLLLPFHVDVNILGRIFVPDVLWENSRKDEKSRKLKSHELCKHVDLDFNNPLRWLNKCSGGCFVERDASEEQSNWHRRQLHKSVCTIRMAGLNTETRLCLFWKQHSVERQVNESCQQRD